MPCMAPDTKSILQLCEKLSASRRAEVEDFARFLLQQEQSQSVDADDAWEALIGDAKPKPKLDEFAKAALAEGSEPMSPEDL